MGIFFVKNPESAGREFGTKPMVKIADGWKLGEAPLLESRLLT
jgi:hypothetical protein